MQIDFPYPVLVADIGGTNVRIALAAERDGPLVPVGHYATGDFAGLAEVAGHALAGAPLYPRSMIACGAGPVVGRAIHLTNANWHIDGPAVAERLGLEQGLLLNDFEAQALSLPILAPAWVKAIGPARATGLGMQVVLGPGTGLGLAALITVDGRFLPIASEGSHVDIGPFGALEAALWPHLERVEGRITAETLLSGQGLGRLYRAERAVNGSVPDLADGIAVVEAALADPTSAAATIVRLFWRLLARFAGDMAVTFLAKGGVTITGGILPRLLPFLDEAEFRREFEEKPPSTSLLRNIATELVIAKDVVLSGMAAIAAKPELYWIDYTARSWRQQ